MLRTSLFHTLARAHITAQPDPKGPKTGVPMLLVFRRLLVTKCHQSARLVSVAFLKRSVPLCLDIL